MPELPEVHALVADLGARLAGHTVQRLDVVSFAALKTFDPPVTALDGQPVTGVSRHGKFLDVGVGGLHLVFHLARAGWVRWRATWRNIMASTSRPTIFRTSRLLTPPRVPRPRAWKIVLNILKTTTGTSAVSTMHSCRSACSNM